MASSLERAIKVVKMSAQKAAQGAPRAETVAGTRQCSRWVYTSGAVLGGGRPLDPSLVRFDPPLGTPPFRASPHLNVITRTSLFPLPGPAPLLDRLGGLLGRPGDPLGRLGGFLGRLGHLLGRRGGLLGRLGGLLGRLGRLLGGLGAVWGRRGAVSEPP